MLLKDSAGEIDDEMSIRGAVGASEIVAEYCKDEIKVILKLKLPSGFPLQAVDVSFGQKSGIEESRYPINL
jgi:hypothetical protein